MRPLVGLYPASVCLLAVCVWVNWDYEGLRFKTQCITGALIGEITVTVTVAASVAVTVAVAEVTATVTVTASAQRCGSNFCNSSFLAVFCFTLWVR